MPTRPTTAFRPKAGYIRRIKKRVEVDEEYDNVSQFINAAIKEKLIREEGK